MKKDEMSPGQYKPFSLKLNGLDLIVYPVKDNNPLLDVFENKSEIAQHIESLYRESNLKLGRYHILFVWNLDGKRMTDVWIHKLENWSDGCGPLIKVKTYEGLRETNESGIASGDSIITLGREEEYRRQCNSLEEYLDRNAGLPDFPAGLTPSETFN